jgi:adenine deaminase
MTADFIVVEFIDFKGNKPTLTVSGCRKRKIICSWVSVRNTNNFNISKNLCDFTGAQVQKSIEALEQLITNEIHHQSLVVDGKLFQT